MSITIIVMIALLAVTEIVTGKNAFKSVSVKGRKDCKNPECGGFGDGWGSLGGFCVFCKHDADVGCKCILNDCGKKYWSKTMAEKKLANARGRQS